MKVRACCTSNKVMCYHKECLEIKYSKYNVSLENVKRF